MDKWTVTSAEERYLKDPIFSSLVRVIEHHLEAGQFTPTEAREAVHLATLRFEQNHVHTYFHVERGKSWT